MKDKKKKKQIDENQESPLEDIVLKELMAVPGQEIAGSIWINYPINEQQINDLKECGIVFDKVLYLSDEFSLTEDPVEPGQIIA
jgi:hypothetical protein